MYSFIDSAHHKAYSIWAAAEYCIRLSWASEPFHLSVGLILGGLLVGSIVWRYEDHFGAILTGVIRVASSFDIPVDESIEQYFWRALLRRMQDQVDWTACC